MKIKLLLLIILLGAKVSHAQWTAPKSTFVYDFGETADKFSYSNSETSIYKASYGKKQEFLPVPKSGTAKLS